MNAVVPDGVIVAAERLHNLPDLVRHLQLGQLHYVPAQADCSLAWIFRNVADPDPMFLGLPDPDLLVRGTEPDPAPSIIEQKGSVRKTLIPTVLWLLYDF